MAIADQLLPSDTVFGFRTERQGPIAAIDFESWEQDPDNPMELLEGWVMPMSPGTFPVGRLLSDLVATLAPVVNARGWQMSLDARHRLPQPSQSVVFPDIAIHCTGEIDYIPATDTVACVPDLVIEVLGKETAERDRGPSGAKFRAYQASGVREYFYTWADGREASGFRLEGGAFVPCERDGEGFFSSAILGSWLRLVPAELKEQRSGRRLST